MKKNPKPAKERTKEPVLKEQDQIDVHLKEELQESTSEQGFPQSEETLVAGETANTEDSLSGWMQKPSDEEVLKNGTLVDGKYEIICLLGHGGMGSVYLARHKELGTQVALKVLHRFLANTKSAVERFKTEARAAHTLSSKNLVSVLDYGIMSDGQPYLTMHYIDGVNLFDYLKTHGRLSIGETFSLVKQVASALEEAHSKGIVHRDIKPSNILIEGNSIKDGSVKVVDFGISKGMWGDENTQQVTHTGQIFGSPFYMSPEQCKGETIDFRTDLYSLGCVMFECLTGSRPFEGKNAVETLMLHCNEAPPTLGVEGKPPRGFRETKEILKKLLSKDPVSRYDSASALSLALNVDTESAKNKIVAISQTTKGNRPFNVETMRILTVIVVLTAVYQFLLSYQKPATQNEVIQVSQKPATQNRIQELNELAYPSAMVSPKAESYLKEALKLSELSYGKNSIYVAKAYNRLGHYYLNLNPSNISASEENFTSALQIIDQLAKGNPKYAQGSLKTLRQNFILDLAGTKDSDQQQESLYARALTIGPLPPDENYQHWTDYEKFLLDKGRIIEAAKAYAEKYRQARLSIDNSTTESIALQPATSVAGTFTIAPNQACNLDKGTIKLNVDGNRVAGELTGESTNWSRTQATYKFIGKYSRGILDTTLTKMEDGHPRTFQYSIIRVGKDLVMLGPTVTESNRYSKPPITDAVFESK